MQSDGEGQFHIAGEFGRTGLAQRSANKHAILLGKLGGLFAHDSEEAPGSGGGHGPVVAPSG